MLSIDHQKNLRMLEYLYRNADWEDDVTWHPDEALAMRGITGAGKTTAALEFCRSHSRRLFFSFRNLTADIAPKILSSQHPEVFSEGSVDTWDTFFAALKKHFAGAYHVLVFDDLDDRNDRDDFLKALQAYMKEDKRRNPFVILLLRPECSPNLPCYDQYLWTYTLADLHRSFPSMTDEDRLRLYSITDGLTGLLSYYDETLSFDENLIRFCRRHSFFSSFGRRILAEHFRSPEGYSGVLAAIASDHHRLSDIAAFAGFSSKKCGTYLQALCDAGLVGTRKERSEDRRSTTRYYFIMGYMAFWARFLMTMQTGSIADAPGMLDDMYVYLDHSLAPEMFHRCCMGWFDNHRHEFDVPGHSLVELIFPAHAAVFDHVFQSGNKYCFLKIWTDMDGRHGADDFRELEDFSVEINPFYDNEYILFSIHRFNDSMWTLSKKYDNVHLVEARFLAY